MRKNTFQLLALLPLLAACNNNSDEPVAARTTVKEYSAAQLYNNKSINGVAFNAGETGILAGANITGINNLYELSIADTTMKPLTRSVKESFFPVDYLPGSAKYLYSADQGGNENSHIYLQSPGDTAAKDITPWMGSANSVFAWSNDKKSIFISSNKRNPKFFDLWKADTATWNFTPFFQNDSGYNVNDISRSERYVALSKSVTTDKNELYLYDNKTKSMKMFAFWINAIFFFEAFNK